MNKQISLICLSSLMALLIWSCTSKPTQTGIIEMVRVNGNEIPKIHIDQVDDSATTIKMTDFFEDFRIIPLETKKACLIQNPQIGFTDHSILVGTQSGTDIYRVFEFNPDGKFIQEFGRWGNGPGEHTGYWADELSWYPENNEVFISFNGENENQIFGIDGKFRGQIRNPVRFINKIKKFNDSIWMTPGNIAMNPQVRRDSLRLILYHSNGDEIKVFPRLVFPNVNPNGFGSLGWNVSLYKYQNQWQIYSPNDDTIYRISLDRLDPVAVFDLGPKGKVYRKLENLLGSFAVYIWKETGRHWYISKMLITASELHEYRGQWGGHYEFSLFLIEIDKATGIARNLRFDDDFLGIIPVKESAKMIQWGENGQVYMTFMALELKESIKTALKKENLDPKIRMRLELLDRQVTEDSNPVIVLMKTKGDS